MRHTMHGILAALALSMSAVAYADVTSTGTVTTLYAYNDYGNGDVVFVTTLQPAGCATGYWLPASAAGFKNLYALLITLYTTKATFGVDADPTKLWPGSTGQYCRVTSLYPQ
jgi:hypothetical protein